MLSLTSASRCHRGRVRPTNEDSVLDRADGEIWAVADGVGSLSGGAEASRIVVEALDSIALSGRLARRVDAAEAQVAAAHRRLRSVAELAGVPEIAATVAAVVTARALGPIAACLWAGDSRVYRWRLGALEALTVDHAEAEGGNVITRAVGAAGGVALDVRVVDLLPGDRLIVCTDGLHREAPEAEIASAVGAGPPDEAAGRLLDLALAHGGRDNVGLVVIEAAW